MAVGRLTQGRGVRKKLPAEQVKSESPVSIDSKFELEEFLGKTNDAFLEATRSLQARFKPGGDWDDVPFVYHVPRMELTVNLKMSYDGKQVRGVFRKKTTQQSEEMSSMIRYELVAIPRTTAGEGEGE